jgi:carboxylate-amine ligase
VTQKARYDDIMHDLQILGLRNMVCGLHVHVEVPDQSARINLIMRMTPYLPLFLALSASSPFWQGHLTGLSAYRLAHYDELPRTGLPELFRTTEDYNEYIDALVGAKIIPDASYIWWAIRPSLAFPTIELRVADACTQVDHALAIAALFRCLLRALDRDRSLNAGFDRVGRAITAENKWRAQRYGLGATFIDPISRTPIAAKQWLAEVRALTAEDAKALDCSDSIAHFDRIVSEGTSADRQVALYNNAMANGGQRLTALKKVVDWLAKETQTF